MAVTIEKLDKRKPAWQHGQTAVSLDLALEWRLGGWRWAGCHLCLGGEFDDVVALYVALPGLVFSVSVFGLFDIGDEVRENGRSYGFGPFA